MTLVIFKIENPRDMDDIIRDDIISRQSITTRDARSLDEKGSHFYIKIEGTSDAIKRAEKLVKEKKVGKKLSVKDAAVISDKIRKEEDSANEGMGMIFGD